MASGIEKVEERIKSFTGQLQTECGIPERLVYKHKNQHRRCSYFQYLPKLKSETKKRKVAFVSVKPPVPSTTNESRHVVLPAEVARLLLKNRLLSEVSYPYMYRHNSMISEVLVTLKEPNGSNSGAIAKHIEVKCKLMKKANDSEVTDEIIGTMQGYFEYELNYLVTNLGILIG
ncbi:hypothetical protein BUALT_Bualt08G0039600 [Buddleja alternifolia]|uniref:Uncharacterized protein n=1 Tax=Buddleja alternifolia TaxID=168488 RepID=A0AAV6XA37_9LAMI|nr:hypothetical protein BUALT_Bualt08G0039600 [Buddleja alternifolia]